MKRNLKYSLLLALTLVLGSLVQAQTNSKFLDMDYVKIYPNPVVTEAIIKVSETLDFENRNISITFYNVVGKEVYSVNSIDQSEVRFNRDNLISGMYIYQLKSDNKTISTGRFVVK